MKPEEIGKLLSEKFQDAVVEVQLETYQPWAQIKPEALKEIAKFLRDDERLSFDFLQTLAGLDYKEELEVMYQLFSYKHRHDFKIKVRVPTDSPKVPSVQAIWPTANWHEREAYDLLGIEFEGHPDLRRLLLPDDWVGHPLRKDYKEATEYRGVSTTREYLTGMPTLPTLPPQPKDQ